MSSISAAERLVFIVGMQADDRLSESLVRKVRGLMSVVSSDSATTTTLLLPQGCSGDARTLEYHPGSALTGASEIPLLEEARTLTKLATDVARSRPAPGATAIDKSWHAPLYFASSEADTTKEPESCISGTTGALPHPHLKVPKGACIFPYASVFGATGARLACDEALKFIEFSNSQSREDAHKSLLAAAEKLREVIPLLFSSRLRFSLDAASSIVFAGSGLDAHGGAALLSIWVVLRLARLSQAEETRSAMHATSNRLLKAEEMRKTAESASGKAKLSKAAARDFFATRQSIMELTKDADSARKAADAAENRVNEQPPLLIVHDCVSLVRGSAEDCDTFLTRLVGITNIECVKSDDKRLMASNADDKSPKETSADSISVQSAAASASALSSLLEQQLRKFSSEAAAADLPNPSIYDHDEEFASPEDAFIPDAVTAPPPPVAIPLPSLDARPYAWSHEVHKRIMDHSGNVAMIATAWREYVTKKAVTGGEMPRDQESPAALSLRRGASLEPSTFDAAAKAISRESSLSPHSVSDRGIVEDSHERSSASMQLQSQSARHAEPASSAVVPTRECGCGMSVLLLAASRGYDDVLVLALGGTVGGLTAKDAGIPLCQNHWGAVHKRDKFGLPIGGEKFPKKLPSCIVHGFRQGPLSWSAARGSLRAVKALLEEIKRGRYCACQRLRFLSSVNVWGADALALAVGAPSGGGADSVDVATALLGALQSLHDEAGRVFEATATAAEREQQHADGGEIMPARAPQFSRRRLGTEGGGGCECFQLARFYTRITPAAWLLGNFDALLASGVRRPPFESHMPASAPSAGARALSWNPLAEGKKQGEEGLEAVAASIMRAASERLQLSPIEIAARMGRAGALVDTPLVRESLEALEGSELRAIASAMLHRAIHIAVWNGHSEDAVKLLHVLNKSLKMRLHDPLPAAFSWGWAGNVSSKSKNIRKRPELPILVAAADLSSSDDKMTALSSMSSPISYGPFVTSSGRHLLDLTLAKWDKAGALVLLRSSLASEFDGILRDDAHRLLPSPAVAASPDWCAFAYNLTLSINPSDDNKVIAPFVNAAVQRSQCAAVGAALMAAAPCLDGGWLVPPSERRVSDFDDDAPADTPPTRDRPRVDHDDNDAQVALAAVDGIEDDVDAEDGNISSWAIHRRRHSEFARMAFGSIVPLVQRHGCIGASCTNLSSRLSKEKAAQVPDDSRMAHLSLVYECLTCARRVCAVCADSCHSTAGVWRGCTHCGLRSHSGVFGTSGGAPSGASGVSAISNKATPESSPFAASGPQASSLNETVSLTSARSVMSPAGGNIPLTLRIPKAPTPLTPAAASSSGGLGGVVSPIPFARSTSFSAAQVLGSPGSVRRVVDDNEPSRSVSSAALPRPSEPVKAATSITAVAMKKITLPKLLVKEPGQPSPKLSINELSPNDPRHVHHVVVCVGFESNFRCACEDGSGTCRALQPSNRVERGVLASLRWRPAPADTLRLRTVYPEPIAQPMRQAGKGGNSAEHLSIAAFTEATSDLYDFLAATLHASWARVQLNERFEYSASGFTLADLAADPTGFGSSATKGGVARGGRTDTSSTSAAFIPAPSAADVPASTAATSLGTLPAPASGAAHSAHATAPRRKTSRDLIPWSSLGDDSKLAFHEAVLRILGLMRSSELVIEWLSPADNNSILVKAMQPFFTATASDAEHSAPAASDAAAAAAAAAISPAVPLTKEIIAALLDELAGIPTHLDSAAVNEGVLHACEVIHSEWVSRVLASAVGGVSVSASSVPPITAAFAPPLPIAAKLDDLSSRLVPFHYLPLHEAASYRNIMEPFVRAMLSVGVVIIAGSRAPSGGRVGLSKLSQSSRLPYENAPPIAPARPSSFSQVREPSIIEAETDIAARKTFERTVAHAALCMFIRANDLSLTKAAAKYLREIVGKPVINNPKLGSALKDSASVICASLGAYLPSRSAPFAAITRSEHAFGFVGVSCPRASSALPSTDYRMDILASPTPLTAAIRWRRYRAARALIDVLSDDSEISPSVSMGALGGIKGGIDAPVPSSNGVPKNGVTASTKAALKKIRSSLLAWDKFNKISKVAELKQERTPGHYLNVTAGGFFMPLTLAAANGARSIVKALIAKGALPDRHDLFMNDLVATDTDDAGALAKSSSNLSPLHYAVLAGHLDVVSDFVDWGRDAFAHAIDDDAKRPRYEAWQSQLVLALSIAIHCCHFDIVQFLVNAGVSPLSIDSYQARPLYRALLLYEGKAGDSLSADGRSLPDAPLLAQAGAMDNAGGSGARLSGSGGTLQARDDSSRLRGKIVELLVEREGSQTLLTYFALGIATTLFVAQISFVILFAYSSRSIPDHPAEALLLLKKSLESNFDSSLSSGAGQANVCTYLGWLAANLCIQSYAAALAKGNATVASWSLASAATCGGLLSSIPVMDSCNVSAAAVLLAAATQARLSDASSAPQASPLIFGTLLSGQPAVAGLTVGSSQLIGSMRISLEHGAIATSSSCASWFKGGDAGVKWSSPLPATLQLESPLTSPLASKSSSWASNQCSRFEPQVDVQALSTVKDASRWYIPFGGESDASGTVTTTASSTTTTVIDIATDAELAPSILRDVATAALGRGAAALRAVRLDAALFEQSIGKEGGLVAVRVTTSFPPYLPSRTIPAVRVMSIADVPASVRGYVTQLVLLVLFVVINVRPYGTSSQLRWIMIDVAIPILALSIIFVRSAKVAATPWLTDNWRPQQTSHSFYIDAWGLAHVTYLDDDISAAVLMLAVFRIIEYLERFPMNSACLNCFISACSYNAKPPPPLHPSRHHPAIYPKHVVLPADTQLFSHYVGAHGSAGHCVPAVICVNQRNVRHSASCVLLSPFLRFLSAAL